MSIICYRIITDYLTIGKQTFNRVQLKLTDEQEFWGMVVYILMG
jgi:hypothetical protein